MKWLPTVISVISEAAVVLDSIEAAGNDHFARNPDEATAKKFRKGISKARSSLALASRLSKGTDAAAKQDIDAAFDEFKKAYSDVLALLGPLGVVAPSSGDGTMAAPDGDGPLMVPPPEAFTL